MAAMGIPTYGVKLIAQYKVKSRESGKAFTELFIINFILSCICAILYYGFILFFPYFEGKRLLYCIAGLNVIFNALNVDWFYQGIQEYGYIAVRSFVIKVFSLLALVLFVRDSGDYLIYAFISSAALVGNYCFNIIKLKKYVRLSFKDLKFKEHLKHILILFAATIAVEVYVLADTTMLDVLCDSSVVGYYTMSMRIIKLIRSLVVAVSAVFLPQLSYYYFNKEYGKFHSLADRGLHILVFLAMPAAVSMSLVADDAIYVCYGSGFAASVFTTRILSLSILTVAVSNFIGMQILITIGKEKITTISTVCGAVTNITLNYFLIRLYQHNGAAIASVITEALVMLIQLVLSRRYIKLKCGLTQIMVSTIGMSVTVLIIRAIPVGRFARLLLSLAFGGAAYCILAFLMKDEFIISLYKMGRKKKSGDPV